MSPRAVRALRLSLGVTSTSNTSFSSVRLKAPPVLLPKAFSSTSSTRSANRTLTPVTTPPIFHTYLQNASSNNTLLLCLFTTSACAPCATISPLLSSLIAGRAPQPGDLFAALALAEVALDSADTSNGPVADLGVEYGVRSLPTLVGFGGRRAQRVTERIVDVKMLADRERMASWIDEQMAKGDPFAVGGEGGGRASSGGGGGIFARLFGG